MSTLQVALTSVYTAQRVEELERDIEKAVMRLGRCKRRQAHAGWDECSKLIGEQESIEGFISRKTLKIINLTTMEV